MPDLKTNPNLKDIQNYVIELERERGFTENTVLQNSLMLGEEIGELFKAIRKTEKMRTDSNSNIHNVEEEMADILIYLCSLANRYQIDLEKAFRDKEEINKKRFWTKEDK
ncbi:pyrophosphohydrolase [Candidatus Gracilibacteria bacterium]|nr:pyrophosphohydrolase [Candidatus Gracilibacteria bacterium]NJS40979.1 pyrophosphohydrolase [Candidatus Gracilibacteria bacterium]